MLGLAIRIAQRMRIDSESACAQSGVLEGEMRRRLWWALVLLDARICQLADHMSQVLTPTWDCRPPLNVNDADLRPEMKEPPAVHAQPTEAIFVVAQSELADFVRNTTFHLDLAAPKLKPIARTTGIGSAPEGRELIDLEKMVEEKYLKFCSLENPLHFMTIWKTRAYLDRCRLMENYSNSSTTSLSQSETHFGPAVSYAIRMLECDSNIMTSTLTKGYRWMAPNHFPFPAYIHLVKHLTMYPLSEHADQAWEVMSDNCDARFTSAFLDNHPFFRMFTKLILHGWGVRETACAQSGEIVVPPRIVLRLKNELVHRAPKPPDTGTTRRNEAVAVGVDGLSRPMPMGYDTEGLLPPTSGSDGYGGLGSGVYHNMPGQTLLDIDMNQLDWDSMDWGAGQLPAW